MKTKKSKLSSFPLSAFAISAFVFTGCTSIRDTVPATEIHGVINGKPVSFVGPKDLSADLIEFRVDTNGVVTVTVKNLNAKTNPDIITTTGDAQAKLIKAQGEAWIGAFEAGGKFAGGAVGAAK